MGIYLKEQHNKDARIIADYFIGRGLLKDEREPVELVDWYIKNAIVHVVVEDGKIIGAVLARRHSVDNFDRWEHDDNGDVLFVKDLAIESHEVVYAMYRKFISDCLSSGQNFPNVIRFQRDGDSRRRNRVMPIIGFFNKFNN